MSELVLQMALSQSMVTELLIQGRGRPMTVRLPKCRTEVMSTRTFPLAQTSFSNDNLFAHVPSQTEMLYLWLNDLG